MNVVNHINLREELPFEGLTDTDMSELGIPKGFHKRVRRFTKRNWREYLNGLGNDEVRQNILAQLAKQEDTLLMGKTDEAFIQLDDTQMDYVRMERKNPIVLRGPAGSGKTAIAIMRIKKGLSNGKKCLYLTYNRALCDPTKALIEKNIRPEDQRRVTVLGFHQYGNSLKKLSIHLKDDLLMEAINDINHDLGKRTYKIFDNDIDWWKRELDVYVSGVAMWEGNKYLTMQRKNAGSPLDRNSRLVVLSVAGRLETLKKRNSKFDFRDQLRTAYDLGNDVVKYDSVVVDEGQDMSPLILKIALNACKTPGSLFITGDDSQSIYPTGLVYKDIENELGRELKFERTIIDRNYRNNEMTLLAAKRIYNDTTEHVTALIKAKDELRPVVVGYNDRDEIYRRIAKEISKRHEGNESFHGNVCMIAPTKKQRWGLTSGVGSWDRSINIMDPKKRLDLTTKEVKTITLHSSKGLEFHDVYLVHIDQDQYPFKDYLKLEYADFKEWHEKTRKLIYVSMTRAMKRLMIFCHQDKPSLFLGNLGKTVKYENIKIKPYMDSLSDQRLLEVYNLMLRLHKRSDLTIAKVDKKAKGQIQEYVRSVSSDVELHFIDRNSDRLLEQLSKQSR